MSTLEINQYNWLTRWDFEVLQNSCALNQGTV
jgi:hypothetical protein